MNIRDSAMKLRVWWFHKGCWGSLKDDELLIKAFLILLHYLDYYLKKKSSSLINSSLELKELCIFIIIESEKAEIEDTRMVL